jgi:hypothetical protein
MQGGREKGGKLSERQRNGKKSIWVGEFIDNHG